ncbi:ATP-binding protein [Exiguobacterium sp. RIT341]|uniref:ATP-binding protein n=1 Tax=Exiguobacterium sp. RIT341 TaxID=1470592 RepID=UPI000447A5AF|nr:ATP-binding protein [Exiguobacterium sp. RIT341]EZP58374.1 putative ATP-binding protein involved in virulence [Exiguobacterium sp. RIT341]
MIKSLKIDKFRNFEDLPPIPFGSELTLISGGNGLGKTTLLGLIASASGTKNFVGMNGNRLYAEFHKYFILSKDEHITIPSEHSKKYKVISRHSLKDSSNKNVEIYKLLSTSHPKAPRLKIVPRTTDEDGVQKKDVQAAVKRSTGVTPDAMIPIPTIFLTPSRILPFGETKITNEDIKKVNFRKNLKNPQEIANLYVNLYNEVLPGTFPNPSEDYEYELYEVKKPEISQPEFYVRPKNYEITNLSVGQDSISKIVNALLSFAINHNSENYPGGILIIDELDLSLHPDAQLRVLNLLRKKSREYKIQVIFTSHSLTIVKEMIRLKNKDQELYRTIYFTNKTNPRFSTDNSYEKIKSDLFQNVHFSLPKVKIYFEDNEATHFFGKVIKYGFANNFLDMEFQKKYDANSELIASEINCDTLEKLPEKDAYFAKKVLIILDGDASYSKKRQIKEDFINTPLEIIKEYTKREPKNKNVMFLPSHFSPEQSIIWAIYNEIAKNEIKHTTFWDGIDSDNFNYYPSIAINQIDTLISNNELKRDGLKKWYNDNLKIIDETDLIEYYLETCVDKEILSDFYSEFQKKFMALHHSIIANKF